MSDEKKMDAILAALPWRCFHCDFVTNNQEEALSHFGERDDGEEFKPLCKWWSNMDEQERKAQFQSLNQDLNGEREYSSKLRAEVENLESQLTAQQSAIQAYKPFTKCRSIHDIFCLYDSMEGRALAAEERLSQIE